MSVQQKSEPVTEITSRVTKGQETEIIYEGSIRMWYWRNWCNAEKTGNWAYFLDDVVMRTMKTQENEAIW